MCNLRHGHDDVHARGHDGVYDHDCDGVNAHGFIMFAGTTPTIEVSDFTASFGDDITTAAENELWEFSVSHPDNYPYSLIIWKNWGVLE